jgi:hypothetical protein
VLRADLVVQMELRVDQPAKRARTRGDEGLAARISPSSRFAGVSLLRARYFAGVPQLRCGQGPRLSDVPGPRRGETRGGDVVGDALVDDLAAFRRSGGATGRGGFSGTQCGLRRC